MEITFVLFLVLSFSSLLSCSEDKTAVMPVQDDSLTAGDDSFEEAYVEVSDELFLKGGEDVFVATEEWQVVKPGQVVPSGLHVRMNLAAGLKEAKLLDDKKEERDDSIGKIDDDAKNKTSNLRSYKDLQDAKARRNMKFNTEFELVEVLTLSFANASDSERKLSILSDLEFYLHQVDNARDFVTIGGLESVLYPAFTATEPQVATPTDTPTNSADIRGEAALAFGACVQSNDEVKEKVLNKGWMATLLDQLDAEQDELARIRIVYALGCLTRGHTRARQEFMKQNGPKRCLEAALKSSTSDLAKKLRFKVATLFSDLSVTDDDEFSDRGGFCDALKDLCSDMDPSDADKVDRISSILEKYIDLCPLSGDCSARLIEISSALATVDDYDHVLDRLKALKESGKAATRNEL